MDNQGWMYRLLDGPYKNNAYGPIVLDPPEVIIVTSSPKDEHYEDYPLMLTDYDYYSESPGELAGDLLKLSGVTSYALYKRGKKSKLTDQEVKDQPFLIRGAEYTLREVIELEARDAGSQDEAAEVKETHSEAEEV